MSVTDEIRLTNRRDAVLSIRLAEGLGREGEAQNRDAVVVVQAPGCALGAL